MRIMLTKKKSTAISKLILFFLALNASLAVNALPNDSICNLRNKLLRHYSILRKEWKPEQVRLLLGNAELGGLANYNGLGFEKLWGAAFWADSSSRFFMSGPELSGLISQKDIPVSYASMLGLEDGILQTSIDYGAKGRYSSELFCSMATPNLIVLKVKTVAKMSSDGWTLKLPVRGFHLTQLSKSSFSGYSTDEGKIPFTSASWAVLANTELIFNVSDSLFHLKFPSGNELIIQFSVTTNWDGANYKNDPVKNIATRKSYDELKKSQIKAWESLWNKSGVVVLPDKAHEELFYRSVYYMLSTCGSRHFLPGETQFALPAWGMHPFTVGAAGWGVLAYTVLGFPEMAKRMAEWHFKPLALQKNAEYFLDQLSRESPTGVIPYNEWKDPLPVKVRQFGKNPDAWSFAHEISIDGTDMLSDYTKPNHYPFDQQRHIDGFAATMFYRISRYYPDSTYLNKRTYPVLRGTAEFWRSLAIWDKEKNGYILPVMQSLSEDFREKNLLESVLAAKWCLQMASHYAAITHKDLDLAKKWNEISEKLIIPQNEFKYIESSGQTGDREGAGYQGVRGVVYLGYPVSELIPQLDKRKVYQTFDDAWIRNRKGEGMISFIADWNALSESFHWRGNETLQYLDVNLQCLDKSGVSLRETVGSTNEYFITSYTAYINAVISMVLQSYDGKTYAFPAIPDSWKDVEFYNLPAESEIRVSGKMQGGKVVWIDYQKDGKKIANPNN
jgi:hypothetical protein